MYGFHLYEVPRRTKLIEIVEWWYTEFWERGNGSYCLMGIDFELCKIERSGDGWWW